MEPFGFGSRRHATGLARHSRWRIPFFDDAPCGRSVTAQRAGSPWRREA
jgi:hypothetical protein